MQQIYVQFDCAEVSSSSSVIAEAGWVAGTYMIPSTDFLSWFPSCHHHLGKQELRHSFI